MARKRRGVSVRTYLAEKFWEMCLREQAREIPVRWVASLDLPQGRCSPVEPVEDLVDVLRKRGAK